MYADSFTSLWKQVTTARQKDLPKTELQWLDQIVKKARQEKVLRTTAESQMDGSGNTKPCRTRFTRGDAAAAGD